ncbi:hypothetical protein R50076_12970 [Gilvimarinus japonicus]
MNPELLQCVSLTLKCHLAEQPATGPEHLATQLGLSCNDILRMAENDPSVSPELFIHAAIYLGIAPELVQMLNDYRHQG